MCHPCMAQGDPCLKMPRLHTRCCGIRALAHRVPKPLPMKRGGTKMQRWRSMLVPALDRLQAEGTYKQRACLTPSVWHAAGANMHEAVARCSTKDDGSMSCAWLLHPWQLGNTETMTSACPRHYWPLADSGPAHADAGDVARYRRGPSRSNRLGRGPPSTPPTPPAPRERGTELMCITNASLSGEQAARVDIVQARDRPNTQGRTRGVSCVCAARGAYMGAAMCARGVAGPAPSAPSAPLPAKQAHKAAQTGRAAHKWLAPRCKHRCGCGQHGCERCDHAQAGRSRSMAAHAAATTRGALQRCTSWRSLAAKTPHGMAGDSTCVCTCLPRRRRLQAHVAHLTGELVHSARRAAAW